MLTGQGSVGRADGRDHFGIFTSRRASAFSETRYEGFAAQHAYAKNNGERARLNFILYDRALVYPWIGTAFEKKGVFPLRRQVKSRG